MAKSSWPEDHIESLIELWPLKTATEIGEILGRSKNSVIGKAHRLGLVTKALGRERGFTVPSRKPPKPKPYKPKPPAPPPYEGPVPLMKATAFHCRAVVDGKDENGLAMICGKLIVPGQAFSFCSEHLPRFTTKGYRYDRGEPINK